MPKKTEQKERIKKLQELITYHQKRYHEDDAPEISDEAYDSLLQELWSLEGGTGTIEQRAVGGAVNEAFSKVTHQARQWSLGNVFTETELREWEERLVRHLHGEDVEHSGLSYVLEHKLDGLKLILEYEEGTLVRAATRGDGVTGEDVTHTASTITDVPKKLKKPYTMVVVGEVILTYKEFERVNVEREKAGEALFANPRNAAAGSLRLLDASVTKKRNLSYVAYDIDVLKDIEVGSQWEELQVLKQLGFQTNQHNARVASVPDIVTYYSTWTRKKDALAYGVDGVVIKVDDHRLQTALGYTAKAPRFGVAFKFPAEEATTVVEDIQLQVGRTGVITPVAHLKPVLIAGSTVSRATLHNEDEIMRLDVRVGDTVILKKAGDIIPKVLSVVHELRPEKTKPYRFPKKVSACGGDGSIERIPGEAAYRCVDRGGDTLNRQRLYYFVSKQALNFDGIGPRIIDQLLDAGLVSEPGDLFTLKKGDFLELEGFKEKAADNAVAAIEAARSIPLYRFLIGLSIDGVGEETARLLADHFGTFNALRRAQEKDIETIHGIGDTVASELIAWLANTQNQKIVDDLLSHLIVEESVVTKKETALSGKNLVFTGTLQRMGRDEAKDLARKAGAKIVSSVSKKTDYVIVGDDPGSKATKAAELGVEIITEAAFEKLLHG